jgi:hypothetical protein
MAFSAMNVAVAERKRNPTSAAVLRNVGSVLVEEAAAATRALMIDLPDDMTSSEGTCP